MEQCSFFPEANSMILAEKGYLKLLYDNESGWKYRLNTVVRKKIFNAEDSDEGNIKIHLYTPDNSSNKESISSFKAYSYNMEAGKIERIKINFKEAHKRKLSDNVTEVNYVIPNIKKGTVIEYQYVKTSDYLNNLETWYFQSLDIPTAHSEFSYTIPEWFNYQINQLGNVVKGGWESKNANETFTIRYKKELEFSVTQSRSRYENSQLKSNSKQYRGVFTNIKPVTKEPFTANLNDIPSRIEFQLESINYPSQPLEMVAGSYESFNKELLDNSSFGKRLDTSNFIDHIDGELAQLNPTEKSIYIYSHIRKHFSWNKLNRYISSSAGRSAYKKAEGSVADINLKLIAALRNYNIKAYPIILSTRGHGTIHPVYPNYDEFNYVIAGIEIGGKKILLDASSNLPFGKLPIKCRNGKGWQVDKEKKGWVDLKNDSNYSITSMINFEITEQDLKVEIMQQSKNYAGFSKIDEVNELSDEEFKEKLAGGFIDFEISDIEISNKGYSKPISLKYSLLKENEGDDFIYIQPVLMGTITENPFTRESRDAPIDFAYQQNYLVVVKVNIPEGYNVELPESSIINLPDGGGQFRFIAKQLGNVVNIQSKLSISKTFFSNADYLHIKEFYDLVSAKNKELIVLEKI
tara:strand:+ start:402 stop:2303 length:1902 start_codon:yes stop_codon:yes gene_type:complete